MNKKLNEFECINIWIAGVRQDKSTQYKYGKRKEHIGSLMEFFTSNDIDQDTAQMMKNRVVDLLVTQKGMSDKDQYKGWKKNAQEDYDDAIQLTYVMPKIPTNTKSRLGNDQLMIAWLKAKFGNNISEDLIQAAHVPMHSLRLMFINDNYKRDTGGVL